MVGLYMKVLCKGCPYKKVAIAILESIVLLLRILFFFSLSRNKHFMFYKLFYTLIGENAKSIKKWSKAWSQKFTF